MAEEMPTGAPARLVSRAGCWEGRFVSRPSGVHVSEAQAGSLRRLQNFVDGRYVDSESQFTLRIVNPSTGQAYAEAPISGGIDVDEAFWAAEAAFPGWRDTTPSARSLALLRIADALEARAEELVTAEAENTGKPIALT